MRRLIEIQNELKAPKNQRNNFGGYNYRSCEDILEAVKPLLNKHGLALIINDDVISSYGTYTVTEKDKTIQSSNRIYIKATATLYDEEGKIVAQTTALAREEETQKGMSASQLTGSTSSYARKYALNGLFAIDDNKDSDATNTHEKTQKEQIKEVKNDNDILAGIVQCKTEQECNDYWKNNVSKLSGANARKQLAELKKQRIEAINGGN